MMSIQRTYSQGILICDNGGFEDDFQFYTGEISFNGFDTGSGSCTPTNFNGDPVTFNPSSLPLFRAFEIVSTNSDPITQYSTVKFESKALQIGNRYGEVLKCTFADRIKKIVKEFTVTEENRNFTVWYSAVLHNPSDPLHAPYNNQPFFSIKCDLAPNSDLCFDGITIPSNPFTYPIIECAWDDDPVKATNWACHRVFIDQSFIGMTATLEITAAPCGGGEHFGYAYIDGICEPCDGSSYGSGSINKNELSCAGDSITINGTFTEPTISGGFTILDDFFVPGFTIYGKTINAAAKTFSFRILKSDFQAPNPTCRDVIAYLQFKNSNNNFLPDVPSNALKICLYDFVIPSLNIIVNGCHRNNPTDNNYSDDYYYVDFTIQNADNVSWSLERQLDDPPSGESGRYFLKQNGYGNGLHILGPFLIQEGTWTLILNYNHCADTFFITPPDYCSGCPALAKVKITNITCVAGNTWTYDLLVAGNPPAGSTYRIVGEGFDRFFGMQYTDLPGGAITQNCIDLRLQYYFNNLLQCPADFKICPPKPCFDDPNDNNDNLVPYCQMEASIERLNCLNNNNYSIDFITRGAGFPCYKAIGNATNVSGAFTNPIGPFTEDVTITLFSCPTPFSCTCTSTNCYKVFFVDRPDDCPRDLEGRLRNSKEDILENELIVVPNPVIADEFLLRSKLKITEFEIFNSTGAIISNNKFEGSEYRVKFNNSQGVYYIKYRDSSGQIKSVKLIKL